MTRLSRSAFTLIELLVVITIIVVLLALLTPALDTAIYQAELAVCGARVKGLAQGATMYAHNNKRMYPYRDTIERSSGQPSRLSAALPGLGFSDLHMLDGYTGRKNYTDPLLPELDYNEFEAEDNTFANYSLWWSYFFIDHSPMRKIGQRFSWTSSVEDRVFRFDLLASDIDWLRVEEPGAWSSHPDSDGLLSEKIYDHSPILQIAGDAGALQGFAAFWYQSGNARMRGTIDSNYAFNDGSVHRYDQVRWDEWEQDDAAFVKVPEDDEKDDVTDYNHLPRN